MKHYTRFRAYQLGTSGASFSLSVDSHFTLIEARYNDKNAPHIKWEMYHLGISRIDVLHITSWDLDHCSNAEIDFLLQDLNPKRIEMPSYAPHTDNAKSAKRKLMAHKSEKVLISQLMVIKEPHTRLYAQDIVYNPFEDKDKSNDNSIAKLFRIGTFTVLSLGDCESEDIRDVLMGDDIITNEVDILILAHHGSDNGFTTLDFLKAVKPQVAICASDYGNKYGHPDKVILQRLRLAEVDYYSTKTGDIIAQSVDKYTFKVSNYISNNEQKATVRTYSNKTYYVAD